MAPEDSVDPPYRFTWIVRDLTEPSLPAEWIAVATLTPQGWKLDIGISMDGVLLMDPPSYAPAEAPEEVVRESVQSMRDAIVDSLL